MDILIKNMEMPSCCGNCQFNQCQEANPWTIWEICMFLNKDTEDVGNNRLADCPLVALPEHGDLIDRNELPIIGITDYKLENHTVVEFEDVLNAPVILEANNGTDD